MLEFGKKNDDEIKRKNCVREYEGIDMYIRLSVRVKCS